MSSSVMSWWTGTNNPTAPRYCAFTFVAQTNAILINGLSPVFVDVDEDGQLALSEIKKYITKDTLAIFPANLLGKRADVIGMKRIADEHDIFVVEDSCEAYGIWEGSDFATFSFFPSHTITTGEGGMIITDNDKHAEMARKIANHGRKSDNILEKFHFDFLGFNGKMSNVLAAIGCAVVDTADGVIEKRKENVKTYNRLLDKDWFAESPHCYPVTYKTSKERDETLKRLEENGVEARKLFSCIPKNEYGLPGDYPNAQYLGAVGLFVPVHQDITEDDIKKIVSLL